MFKLLAFVLAMSLSWAGYLLAETIPGGHILPCTDSTAFTPIYGDDGETVAYWNNPTCSSPDGGVSPSNCEMARNCDSDSEEEPVEYASK